MVCRRSLSPLHGVHALGVAEMPGRPLAVIVFYRAYLLAADLAPIEALARALDREGLNVRALYVGSLKDRDTGAFVAATLRDWRPSIVLNATAFSARLDDAPSPLRPRTLQSSRSCSQARTGRPGEDSSRGLSQADLAMQVVLPELDGRLLTTAISFKAEQSAVAGLEFARVAHQPDRRRHCRRGATRRRSGRGSPPRRESCASSRWCCPTIRVRPGKRPTPSASTPSRAAWP